MMNIFDRFRLMEINNIEYLAKSSFGKVHKASFD